MTANNVRVAGLVPVLIADRGGGEGHEEKERESLGIERVVGRRGIDGARQTHRQTDR